MGSIGLPKAFRRLRPHRRWGLSLFFLFLAAWRYSAPVAQYVDIGLFDETRYLLQGLQLDTTPLRDAFRSPLYALWYAGLSRFVQDPLALYDLNYLIQLIALPLLVYWALTAYASPLWAFLVAWVVLLSDLNLEPWPRVSAFAWMILLLGLGLAWRVQRPWIRAAVITGSAWLASYVRPEFMLAAGLFFLGYILSWQRRKAVPALFPYLGTMAALGGITLLWMGSPHTEPGRAFSAFGQHFMYRWHDDFNLPQDWSHWSPVIEAAFGPQVDSLLDALLANPQRFLQHILANLRDNFLYAPGLVLAHTPVFLERSRQEAWVWLGLWVGMSAISLIHMARKRISPRSWGTWIGPLTVLTLPSLLSIAIIYPRGHYQLGFYLPLFLIWALIVHHVWHPWKPQTLWYGPWGWVVALFLVFITPPLTKRASTPPPQETRRLIETLRLLTAQEPRAWSLVVPFHYWHRNLEVYLPSRIHPILADINTPEQLQGYRGKDFILLPWGQRLLHQAREQGLLETFPQDHILCTPQGTWVLLVQRTPPRPDSLPMDLCP